MAVFSAPGHVRIETIDSDKETLPCLQIDTMIQCTRLNICNIKFYNAVHIRLIIISWFFLK